MPIAYLLAALFFAAPAAAAAPVRPADGRAVMNEVDRRRHTASEYSEGLITVEEKGKSKSKSWRSWHAGWGGEAKGLIQFLEPAEVKGVGLLTISAKGRPADQWFYAPAIDRERRVARQEKSTRFLGTHFTYEDMEERDIESYDYTLDGEESTKGALCYKVTATPHPDKESQYSKLVFWVLEDRFVTIRVEAYVEGQKRRTFEGSDVRDVSGIPIVHAWSLTDTKREGTTRLTLANVKINPPIPTTIFTVAGMKTLHE